MQRMHFARSLYAVVFSLTIFASPAYAGFESGGGASPIAPLEPEPKFRLACELTWISDVGMSAGSGKIAASRTRFSLNNDQTSISTADLKWNHGYAESFDFANLNITGVGKGEAVGNSPARPESIQMTFAWANPNLLETQKPQLKDYSAQLEVSYYQKSSKNAARVFHSASVTQNLSSKIWIVSGRVIVDEKNSAQTSVFTRFELKCQK